MIEIDDVEQRAKEHDDTEDEEGDRGFVVSGRRRQGAEKPCGKDSSAVGVNEVDSQRSSTTDMRRGVVRNPSLERGGRNVDSWQEQEEGTVADFGNSGTCGPKSVWNAV